MAWFVGGWEHHLARRVRLGDACFARFKGGFGGGGGRGEGEEGEDDGGEEELHFDGGLKCCEVMAAVGICSRKINGRTV